MVKFPVVLGRIYQREKIYQLVKYSGLQGGECLLRPVWHFGVPGELVISQVRGAGNRDA